MDLSILFLNSGVEYISCSTGIFDVASQEQAQDFDPHNICMCWNCCNHAIHYKVCFNLSLHLPTTITLFLLGHNLNTE